VQFDIYPPPGVLFAPPVTRQPFAISPDGKRLAFTATGADGTHIWIRELASPDLRRVPGADGAVSVFWPPDGRSLFFSTKQTLMQSNLDTGSTRSLADLIGHAQTVTWRPNGDLLLYIGAGDNFELRAGDSSPRQVQFGEERIRWPQFLPGSNRVIYVTSDPATHGFRGMAAEDVGRKPAALMETDSRLQYAPPRRAGEPGHLLFMHRGNLLAQSFDADHLQLAGEAFPVAQNVIYYGPTLSANFSVSGNGILVYQAGFPTSELKWYDRGGNELGAVGRPATHWGNVRISHDGRRVAATVWTPETGGAGIWVFDVNGRESRRLTFPPEVHRRPVWSHDGMRLAFGGSRYVGGGPRLAALDLAGNGTTSDLAKDLPESEAKRIANMANLPTDWSRDGRFIAFDDGVGHEVQKAMILDTAEHKVVPLLDAKFPQWGIAFSPDGSRIAFVSMESGRPEIDVQALDHTSSPHLVGDRRQVSRDGAWLVRWRADGRELFYLGMDNSIYAAPLKGPLEFGDPKPLFRITGPSQYGTPRDFQFDVSPDGQRFIMPNTGSAPPPPFTVIENWQDKFHR
jgi:Tol biopolymer transport system component